jgi:hypothetical protein
MFSTSERAGTTATAGSQATSKNVVTAGKLATAYTINSMVANSTAGSQQHQGGQQQQDASIVVMPETLEASVTKETSRAVEMAAIAQTLASRDPREETVGPTSS